MKPNSDNETFAETPSLVDGGHPGGGWRHPRRLALCGSVLVFLLCAVLTWQVGDRHRFVDEQHYHTLAMRLLQGQGFVHASGEPTVFRPPGYPFLMAGIYHLWPRPMAVKGFQALLMALLAWQIGSLASRVSSGGRPFGALLLAYPVLLYTATTLYPQTLGAVLLVGSFAMLTRTPHRFRHDVLGGLLYGALVLAIPSFLMVLPLLLLLRAGFETPVGRGRVLAGCALFAVCAVLCVLPWTARNAWHFGRLVPVSANAGVNLLLGNSEATEPTAGVTIDLTHYAAETADMDEIAADRHYRRRALEWIRKNPWRAFGLYGQKVAAYFHFRNRMESASESTRWREVVMALTYYPLLALGGLRLGLCRRFPLRLEEKMIFGLTLGNVFLSALFFPRLRFRLPFDVLWIAGLALFATQWLAGRRRVRGRIHGRIHGRSGGTGYFSSE